MGAAFDLNAEHIRESLADTVAWCATQPITATVDKSEELKRRERMVEEVNQLRTRAIAKRQGFWDKLFRRSYLDSREWKLADELRQSALLSPPFPLSTQLRTPALKPSHTLEESRSEQEKIKLVREVVSNRRDLLQGRPHLINSPNVSDSSSGRLLVYVPDENVEDGASEWLSLGFFDGCDAPPWDTWVAFADRTLLAWVPAQMIKFAQEGIDVNAVECINWLG